MAERMPVGELDPRYGSDGVTATPWTTQAAPDDPVILVGNGTSERAPPCDDDRGRLAGWGVALHDWEARAQGEEPGPELELHHHRRCHVFRGLDVVVEGKAMRVTGAATLRRLAKAYRSKYVGLFRFEVRKGGLYPQGSRILAYRLGATKALGFGKGRKFSQTRWRF